MRSSKPILIVDDDEIDAETIVQAFKDNQVTNQLDLQTNGEEALSYLKEGKHQPCLILLDLNMPRMGGFEFLEAAREENLLDKIPVIILTTSREQADVVKSYALGAAGYMVKPLDYLKFYDLIKTINTYWTLCELPQ